MNVEAQRFKDYAVYCKVSFYLELKKIDVKRCNILASLLSAMDENYRWSNLFALVSIQKNIIKTLVKLQNKCEKQQK